MLKSLKIKNFQSHKDTELQFHPGINVIHGRNTSGKSAIIRALLLGATNRPSGFRFNSNFADGPTEVEICVPEATVLFRKDKKQATYIVDGEEFSGFGMSVPDVVPQKLNLSDLNISKQLDQHFLITASPGEVAKTLNKITRIDEVDKWVSKLTTKINSNNKEVSLLTEQCKEIDEQLAGYRNVDEADKKLAELEALTKTVEDTKSKIETLEFMCSEIDRITLRFMDFEFIELCDYSILELERLIQEQKEIVATIDMLNGFIELSERVDEYSVFDQIDADLDYLEVKMETRATMRKEVLLIESVLRDIAKTADDIKTAALIYKRRKKDYSDLLISLKRCPVCLSEITSDTIDSIIKDM